MKRSFKALNISCQGCANTIMVSLEDEFGDLEVDLSQDPKVVSLDIKDEEVEKFKAQMKELGFEVVGEA